MPQTLLAATTSATASEAFAVHNHGPAPSMPAHFTCPGIAGSETGTLQKKNADGSYSDYYIDGVLQQITASHTGVVVFGPGWYRINKSATAASVPVEVSTGAAL